jgi:hypothetical protein
MEIHGTGETLAVIHRGGNDYLLIQRDTFKGYPYLSVRLWFKGDDGNLHPTQKGVSIRLSELDEVIDTLQHVWVSINADGGNR